MAGIFEDLGAQAFSAQFNRMTPDQKAQLKATLADAEAGLHDINVKLADDTVTGDELNDALGKVFAVFGKAAYRGVFDTVLAAVGHIGDIWK
jgi:hypothetical protein